MFWKVKNPLMTEWVILKDGGLSKPLSQPSVPPSQVVVNIPFFFTPRYKDKEFLHHKYIVERLSLAQIAAEISSSKEAVRQGLKSNNIALRDHAFHHGHPSQICYGRKLRKGRGIVHVGENEVIKRVLDLRKSGLSLRKIANVLTETGVPTQNRGRAWHPQMISRLISRQETSGEIHGSFQII